MYCKLCSQLTIERLVDLADKELAYHWAFPSQHFYRHQPCFSALRISAISGCELCKIFYDGILETMGTADLVDEMEAEGQSTQVKCALRAAHLENPSCESHFRRPLLFDILMLHVGLPQVGLAYDGEYDILPVEFTLYSTTCMSALQSRYIG